MTRTPLQGQKVKGQLAGAGHIVAASRTACSFLSALLARITTLLALIR